MTEEIDDQVMNRCGRSGINFFKARDKPFAKITNASQV